MKLVIIEDAAECELDEAVGFYERRKAGLGKEFAQAVHEAIRAIQADPTRHPLRKDDTRRWVMDRFPFIIHYMDLADCIWVVAVAHTSRRPGYWKPRLDLKL